MKAMKEYVWEWERAGKNTATFVMSYDETLYKTVTTLERVQSIISVAVYVLVVSALFFMANRLAGRSTLIRMLRVRSSRAVTIGDAIEGITGRKARLLICKGCDNGYAEQTIQLEIYRLEEATLRELIQSIDPAAEIDVASVHKLADEDSDESQHWQKRDHR
jgi:preprotein translocase subunit SecE